MQWKKILTTIKPYKPGRSTEDVKKAYRLDNVVKLASNENPYGCASTVSEFLSSTSMPFEIYPDGHGTTLRQNLLQSMELMSHPSFLEMDPMKLSQSFHAHC